MANALGLDDEMPPKARLGSVSHRRGRGERFPNCPWGGGQTGRSNFILNRGRMADAVAKIRHGTQASVGRPETFPMGCATMTNDESQNDQILGILRQARLLAQRYRDLTGKPLGITGEVAEYEAARILGIRLTPARQAGYDAIEMVGLTERRLQIKGRCLPKGAEPGQRLGSIDIGKEWDAVLMVLLDESLEAVEIHEADRESVIARLSAPGSKSRNERGSLGVTQFKAIGRLRWRRPTNDRS